MGARLTLGVLLFAIGMLLLACVFLLPAIFLLQTHFPQARVLVILAGILIGCAWGIITLHRSVTLLVQGLQAARSRWSITMRSVDLVGSVALRVLLLAGTWTFAQLPEQVPPPGTLQPRSRAQCSLTG